MIDGGYAMSDSPLNIVIFYGSVRSARQGIKAARFILRACQQRGHTAVLIDPLEYSLPLIDKMYKEYAAGTAPPLLQKLADLVIAADTYIVVSGEYNHSIPPALANLMDHFLEEYFRKPSAIVSYSAGPFGGVRAAIALRSMLAEMGASSIPSILPISAVQNAFDDDGTPKDPQYHKRAARFFEELEWYATALREARNRQCPRSESDTERLVLKDTPAG
jgi:NAD(P)H-dependent FMN reductase